MKRILLTFTAVCAAFSMNAQMDTISAHFVGTPTVVGSAGAGYVSGNNDYGDIGKYQRFDASLGILGGGELQSVLLWIPIKDDNGGSFTVDIIDFTGGTAGAVLASETVTLASVDTAIMSLTPFNSNTMAYNVAVTLSTPLAITGTTDILIGIGLPVTTGDTMAVISSTDGDFTDAVSHTWEQWSDNSFISTNDGTTNSWEMDIAFGIFPVISYYAGLNEATVTAKVYPNPATDVLNITASNEVSTVSIIGMDGKVISTTDVNGTTTSVDIAALNAGVYFYEVVTVEGTVRNTFVKK
ncbi:MAG: T9SS type A sorting domain-containing protein [Crocinitomicaceae bacterium]|nr:T9SS type A sorting domain-containing protein [Crocinitomicaceae bacterium]